MSRYHDEMYEEYDDVYCYEDCNDDIYIDPESVWYDIPGHPNHQVNLKGEVRHKRKKNILKPIIDKDGYVRMSLGSVDNVPIHRAACMAFYGLPEDNNMQVNHINCDRQDNHFWNLEWVTPSENIKWGVSRGNIDPYKGLRKAAEVNPKQVRIVETGQVFYSVKDCAEYLGTRPTNISRVLTGERKGQKIHGYHIEYVREEEM